MEYRSKTDFTRVILIFRPKNVQIACKGSHINQIVIILVTNDLNAILSYLLSTVILYALSAVYFAGVMVRLMLTLTPVVCVLAAIAISKTLNEFLVDDAPSKKKFDEDSEYEEDEEEREKKSKKLYDKVAVTLV